MMTSFKAARDTGDSGVCVVTGYSGAGKTFLIRNALGTMKNE